MHVDTFKIELCSLLSDSASPLQVRIRFITSVVIMYEWISKNCSNLKSSLPSYLRMIKKRITDSVADLGEGPRGPGPPLFVEYLQKIYKKVTEMSIQKPF